MSEVGVWVCCARRSARSGSVSLSESRYAAGRYFMKIKETDVSQPIVEFLQVMGWEVFQEVGIGRSADIVARRDKLIWVVETKTSLSLKVMEQASNWKGYANYVSIGIPETKNRYGKQILKQINTGCLEVSKNRMENLVGFYEPGEGVYETVKSKFWRRRSDWMEETLKKHKDINKAGVTSTEKITPFKETVSEIVRYLRRHPGSTMKEIADNVPSHYSSHTSMRSCIPGYIKSGVIKNIMEDDKVSPCKYYLEESYEKHKV